MVLVTGGLKQVLVTSSVFGERQDKLYSMWGTSSLGQVFETEYWFRAADIVRAGRKALQRAYVNRHIQYMSDILKVLEVSSRMLPEYIGPETGWPIPITQGEVIALAERRQRARDGR